MTPRIDLIGSASFLSGHGNAEIKHKAATMTIKTRLQKLEQAKLAELQAEFNAAITAWLDWVDTNTTEAEQAAYRRALIQAWRLPDDPSDPSWGDPQPDDRAVAEAIERRGPYELIDRLYKALGRPGAPFSDNRKDAEETRAPA